MRFYKSSGLSTVTGSIKISIQKSNENTSVILYDVFTSGSLCQISAAKKPLACMLVILRGGTQYAVEAIACVSDSQCSRSVARDGFALPDRKHRR